MGIACSTFLFVAALFRSGVVKFAASGLTVRSTIERGSTSSLWLDENGDLIQVRLLLLGDVEVAEEVLIQVIFTNHSLYSVPIDRCHYEISLLREC